MDEKEYLQTLGEQIVNPHARASVLAEIQDHIEEQAQDYRASGMSEAVAMQEAVRQMGDPVSTGEALNQVHRPKFPIALFGLAVVLTVLGIAMQYLVYTHLTPDTAILSDTYLQRTILYNAIGLGLLLLCIFGNYMYLAKGAWILLAIFLLGLLPPWFFGFYGRQYTLCYYLALVYPLVYALLLYRLRDKGGKSHLVPARTNAFVSRPDAFWHNYHLVNGACCRMPDAFAALPCHSSWHTDWQL